MLLLFWLTWALIVLVSNVSLQQPLPTATATVFTELCLCCRLEARYVRSQHSLWDESLYTVSVDGSDRLVFLGGESQWPLPLDSSDHCEFQFDWLEMPKWHWNYCIWVARAGQNKHLNPPVTHLDPIAATWVEFALVTSLLEWYDVFGYQQR